MDKESKYWQQEWKIEYKNRKLKIAVISAILLLLAAAAAYYISIRATRTTFSSKEEMRSYVQGKWTTEAYPEEYVFEGDNVTHTIYDTENPENDHINEDVVVRWDYIRGRDQVRLYGASYNQQDRSYRGQVPPGLDELHEGGMTLPPASVKTSSNEDPVSSVTNIPRKSNFRSCGLK